MGFIIGVAIGIMVTYFLTKQFNPLISIVRFKERSKYVMATFAFSASIAPITGGAAARNDLVGFLIVKFVFVLIALGLGYVFAKLLKIHSIPEEPQIPPPSKTINTEKHSKLRWIWHLINITFFSLLIYGLWTHEYPSH